MAKITGYFEPSLASSRAKNIHLFLLFFPCFVFGCLVTFSQIATLITHIHSDTFINHAVDLFTSK